MKRSRFSIRIVLILFFGTVFTGCESSAQKEIDTYEQNYNFRRRQESIRQDSNVVVLAGVSNLEWEKFKAESETGIKGNVILITDLKMRIKRSGKKSDMVFEKWVYILEQKNKFLKERIRAYPEIQSDWESFKIEINKEMEDLSKALKDLGAQNQE
jgi:hypothetical protein